MISIFSKKQGFAILYAILMVSIVLTISLTLLDISYKQLVLSSINKESKLAYYAAINAFDCATYWDNFAFPHKPFGYFEGGSFFSPTSPDPGKINCTGVPFTATFDGSRTSTFDISFPDGSFAEVTVVKGTGTDPEGTFIRADGYNTSNPNSPRRVQRSHVSE